QALHEAVNSLFLQNRMQGRHALPGTGHKRGRFGRKLTLRNGHPLGGRRLAPGTRLSSRENWRLAWRRRRTRAGKGLIAEALAKVFVDGDRVVDDFLRRALRADLTVFDQVAACGDLERFAN